MKKILLYAVGCVVIVVCVVCYFAFTQTRELQECKSERDKISGCVEKEYVDAYGARLWFETPYKNGKKHGIAKRYYENGNLEYETPYKNGKKHGIEKWYYENGNLWYETPYENDKRHGIAKAYYENGSLQAQVTYENDNVLSGVCGDGKKIPNIHGLEEQKDIIHKIFESCSYRE